MLYNIRLHLHYDYERSAAGGRHHIRVMPQAMPGIQRIVASSLSFDPVSAERSEFTDFFSTSVTSIVYRNPHETLDVTMMARVNVTRPQMEVVNDLNKRIHADFTYDGDATDVRTTARQAFDLKAGVCQDFSHVMIAGLRGLGIPAGYVSGFLRTIPRPGKERLEGADAMHAWVRAWCGREAGWQELDPTNDMVAGNDHITIGYGRDYSDVSPIVGVLKTSGSQKGKQSVDVIPLE
jgi:transglutaminase-like putative cysteine protease